MTDLVEWLEEQLRTDEQIARAATPGPWQPARCGTEDDQEELLAVTRAIHDVDCDRGEGCDEVLTTEGRYGRYATAAIAAVRRIRHERRFDERDD